jgi:hypothetical protein
LTSTNPLIHKTQIKPVSNKPKKEKANEDLKKQSNQTREAQKKQVQVSYLDLRQPILVTSKFQLNHLQLIFVQTKKKKKKTKTKSPPTLSFSATKMSHSRVSQNTLNSQEYTKILKHYQYFLKAMKTHQKQARMDV